MTTQPTPTATKYRSVPANGIDIHYLEAGQGEPLVLLHGGMVSTNPIWAPTPVSCSAHMEQLAERLRVIAPDTRGCGRTRHSGGTVTFDLLADDVLALIDALGLDRPLIAGFSEGAVTATIVGIRRPDSPTMILVGDRDQFCTAEEALTAYRALKHGGLAVLPDTGHILTPAAIDSTINFLERPS
jgi:pimeloyl-ACP methyl ester carboxylesterase